jgi:hypothetical protein
MPHDAAPRNGGTYESGVPGWVLALAIAVFFSFAATVLAAATGAFLILLSALGLVRTLCGDRGAAASEALRLRHAAAALARDSRRAARAPPLAPRGRSALISPRFGPGTGRPY